VLSEHAREILVQPNDRLKADDWCERGRPLAAAVGVDDNILCEQGPKSLHIAATRGRKERLRDLQTSLAGHRKAWAGCSDVVTGATGELAAGGRLAPDGVRDLLEARPNTS
jgi:hypothetical protein